MYLVSTQDTDQPKSRKAGIKGGVFQLFFNENMAITFAQDTFYFIFSPQYVKFSKYVAIFPQNVLNYVLRQGCSPLLNYTDHLASGA